MIYKLHLLFFPILLFLSSSSILANGKFGDFNDYYKQHKNKCIKFTELQKKKALKIHFIGMPGLFGNSANLKRYLPEKVQGGMVSAAFDQVNPTYFEEMKYVIEHELGSQFTVLYRLRRNSFQENAKYFADELYKKSQPGINYVLVGHSKGGLDAWFTVLLDRPLMDHYIDYVLTIQSPFMGAFGRPNDFLCRSMTKTCNTLLERVDEFVPETIKSLTKEAFNSLSSEQYESFSKKIGYIGSFIRSDKHRTWLTYGLHQAIRTRLDDLESKNPDQHDGLIRARDQVLAFDQEDRCLDSLVPAIGSLWGFIDDNLDHCATVVGGRLLSMTRTYLTPTSLFFSLSRDIEEAKKTRLNLARIIILYYLERVF